MIAPFQNRYRMAWPFAVEGFLQEIDTAAASPIWNVPGDWRVPPPEVCDLLTAKEFTFSFEFNAAAFNAEFGEDFPEDVSFSTVCNSGVWKYNDALTGLQTFNLDYKWDTQRKLFERDTDEDEESIYFNPQGLAGLRYAVVFDFEVGSGYWSFDITLTAPIPVPAIDPDGEYLWSIVGYPSIVLLTIQKVNTSEAFPIITNYDTSDVGSSYLDIDNLGGQGVGAGGCLPTASVSIATHFSA